MLRQMDPRPAREHPVLARELIEERPPEPGRHVGEGDASQPSHLRPRLVRGLVMKAAQRSERAFAQRLPMRRLEHEAIGPCGKGERPGRQGEGVRGPSGQSHQIGETHAIARALEEERQTPAGEHALERRQKLETRGGAALARRGARVQHPAAAHGAPRLRITDDEPIAGHGAERGVEHQLHERRPAPLKLRRFERHQVRDGVRRAEMHVQRRPRRKLHFGIGEELQPHVDARGGRERLGLGEPVAAADGAALDPREIQRTALAGASAVGTAALSVDAAHPRRCVRRHHHDSVSGANAPREYGSGRDRAVTGQREHPIHREAKKAIRGAAGAVRGRLDEVPAERFGAGVPGVPGIERKDRCFPQRRAREQCLHLRFCLARPLSLHTIGLGERHGTLCHAEELEYRNMLAGLGHHAVVGG